MRIDQIPPGTALVVTPSAFSKINKGDSVIVGIHCWINQEGDAIPLNENLQLLRKELNAEMGKGVLVLKRAKGPESLLNNEIFEAAQRILSQSGMIVRYIVRPPGANTPSEIIRLEIDYSPDPINITIDRINVLFPDLDATYRDSKIIVHLKPIAP